MPTCSYRPAAQLRQALLDGAELALIDVREEADFARSHPLFAANLPLSKLELDIFRRVPRLTTQTCSGNLPTTSTTRPAGWRNSAAVCWP